MATATSSSPSSRFSWANFAFGMSVGLLVTALAVGSTAARLGALGGLAGIAFGTAVAVRRHRREYESPQEVPPLPKLVLAAVAESGGFFFYLSAYLALVMLATLDTGEKPLDGTIAEPAFATAATLALAVALVSAGRREFRREGVERVVFLESTCIAFFVTVIAAAGYALFEALADAPTISMWVIWSVGMLAWAIASGVRRRAVA